MILLPLLQYLPQPHQGLNRVHHQAQILVELCVLTELQFAQLVRWLR